MHMPKDDVHSIRSTTLERRPSLTFVVVKQPVTEIPPFTVLSLKT
jgi:hypothetical protein